jgi:hypothetical protein
MTCFFLFDVELIDSIVEEPFGVRLQEKRRRPSRKSFSFDENEQLALSPEEQAEIDDMREDLGSGGGELVRIYWRERLRAARRVFDDPREVEEIVEILERAAG